MKYSVFHGFAAKLTVIAFLLFAILMPLVFSAQNAVFSENPEEEVTVYFFWGPGCPFCENQKPFLEELDQKYPEVEVKSFSTAVAENRDLFSEVGEILGVRTGPVPFTVIGEKHWVGYSSHLDSQMEDKVVSCIEKGCDDPLAQLFGKPTPSPTPTPDEPDNDEDETKPDPVDEPKHDPVILPPIDIPFIGEIIIEIPEDASLLMITFLIAFVDGFNPCSIFLLIFLIGMLISAGSRKKMLIVGLTFLLVTAAGYGLFILSIFNVMALIESQPLLILSAGLIALIFALVNIKDFFWFKKGISFTIPDRFKPKIFKDFRGILHPERSTLSMVIGTIIIAAFLTLAELPCTAGLPLVWNTVLASHEVSGLLFAQLFSVYILTYLSIELAILSIAIITMKMFKFEEKHGRFLKLLGGSVMLAMALVLLFAYELTHDMAAMLLIFGIAVASAFIIAFVHDIILKKK